MIKRNINYIQQNRSKIKKKDFTIVALIAVEEKSKKKIINKLINKWRRLLFHCSKKKIP